MFKPSLGFFLLLHLAVTATSQSDPALHGDWTELLANGSPDALVAVNIVLAAQAVPAEFTTIGGSKVDRREHVRDLLQDLARATQEPILTTLEEHARHGRADDLRPLWIHNVIGARVTTAVALELGGREDVAYVHHDPERELSSVLLSAPAGAAPVPATTCGLDAIGAPRVWSQYGIRGESIVVALIDSGVCRSHSDIADQTWTHPCETAGNGIDDDLNGFVDDTWGWDFFDDDNNPHDELFHGSHVGGTVAGNGAGGTDCGVAPGAELMVLRFHPSELGVWLCMQYAVDNGADVVSASLGWPASFNPDRATWRAVCDNTIAAGLVVIYGAGNEGCDSPPENVRTPADVPDVIAVGAVDCSDGAATFSSCGPVTWENVPPYDDHPYPPGLVKPDVVGPGVDTLSHDLCNGYVAYSGTSAATPHVGGLAALLLQADPTLDHFGVRDLLESTAIDLAAPGKDNRTGSGRIDALAAVTAALGNGNFCEAKQNSCGGTPALVTIGTPSATKTSGFFVRAKNMPGQSPALLIYTDQGAASIPLLGGALCIASIHRTVPVVSNGTAGKCNGVAYIDMNAFRSGSLGGSPQGFLSVPGTTVNCQFWGRDAANTFGAVLTGGLRYTICP